MAFEPGHKGKIPMSHARKKTYDDERFSRSALEARWEVRGIEIELDFLWDSSNAPKKSLNGFAGITLSQNYG